MSDAPKVIRIAEDDISVRRNSTGNAPWHRNGEWTNDMRNHQKWWHAEMSWLLDARYIRADIAQRLAEALREVVPPPGELVSSMEQKWRKQRARERLAEYDALMGEGNG